MKRVMKKKRKKVMVMEVKKLVRKLNFHLGDRVKKRSFHLFLLLFLLVDQMVNVRVKTKDL